MYWILTQNLTDIWAKMEPAFCMPNHCFCEAVHYGSWFRQPVNAFTNGFMIIVVIVIIWQARKFDCKKNSQNFLTSNIVFSYLFAFGVFLTGIGSFYFHSSLTFSGQWFDVMGMYLSITFFMIYNIARVKQLSPKFVIVSYLALNLILGYILFEVPALRRLLFGSFITLFVASAAYSNFKIKTYMNQKYLWFMVASFAVAFIVWNLDLKKIWCNPQSVLQGHGIWHFLSALSLYYMYLYYRSENQKKA